MRTDTDSQTDIALSWLRGESGNHTGRRVLLLTYGDNGYLGTLEGDFVTRHHVARGRIETSPLSGSSGASEELFAQECGKSIQSLHKSGRIKQARTPRQYEGAAVLYELA